MRALEQLDLVIAVRKYHPRGKSTAYTASLKPLLALYKAVLPLASNVARLIVSAGIYFSVEQFVMALPCLGG
jgi:hypothetical protein